MSDASRRTILKGAAASALGAGLVSAAELARALTGVEASELGPALPFSFERLQQDARALSLQPFVKAVVPSPETLDEIDYDQYQKIRYRSDKALRLDRDGRVPVELFHLGHYAPEPVKMHVVEDGKAREVIYSASLFDIPNPHPARRLAPGAGFAGFRVMAADLKTDWFAAMGASYFRSSGPYNQYGLSARGIAIDTAMPAPEEFPRFSQ